MEIVFNEFRDRLLSFLGSLGNRFSAFLALENRLENEGIFCDEADLEVELGVVISRVFVSSENIKA